MFTFVTMVGGNPEHDAYGFRHWNEPSAFLEYNTKGATGRFEGFLGALFSAGFAVVGPEYVSMVAAEAQRPRIFIKTAFKTIYWRFGLFFLGSALAVGIVVSPTDPALIKVAFGGEGGGTANASPYVMAMANMGIKGLPHVINALLFTSIFSAGNTYTYCATRSLYGLALEGRAPAFLRKTWSNGVPIYCFMIVMIFPFLSFLQVGNGSAVVIGWIVDLITAGGLIDFLAMSITFLNYYKACEAQGVDRKSLPYYGRFQPYCAYIALFVQSLIVIFYGYTAFRDFTAEKFFRSYTMQLLAIILFSGWKIIKRTRYVRPHEVDLVWERPTIDRYEASFRHPPVGFWTELGQLIGINRKASSPQDI